MPKDTFPYATVPRLCPGGTVACLASGPSLTREDVDYVRDKVDAVIVTNTTHELAPWADCLFASDYRWWGWYKKKKSAFAGLKYATNKQITALKIPGIKFLRLTGGTGIEMSPDGVRHGENTGYKAVNVAVHFGAKRIIMLGYDMKQSSTGPDRKEHWHGDHPIASRSPYHTFMKRFATMVEPMRELGIEMVNCSPDSALECFPKMPLREALPEVRRAIAC